MNRDVWPVTQSIRAVVAIVAMAMAVGCHQPVGNDEPTDPGTTNPPQDQPVTFQVDFDGATDDVVAEDFAATGVMSQPIAGQLDADAWSVTGFSDGDLDFGQEADSGDLARGSSDGGVSTGGLYAFEIGEGNTAMGVQPTASDFAPGSVCLRLPVPEAGIDSLRVDYTLLVFNDQDRSTRWDVAVSTDMASWVDLVDLGVNTAMDADPEPAWTATARSASIAGDELVPEPADYLYVRWASQDDAGSGGRDECAIDDVVVVMNGD
jgi:hypothetical protein